jgi:hypothetical protein
MHTHAACSLGSSRYCNPLDDTPFGRAHHRTVCPLDGRQPQQPGARPAATAGLAVRAREGQSPPRASPPARALPAPAQGVCHSGLSLGRSVTRAVGGLSLAAGVVGRVPSAAGAPAAVRAHLLHARAHWPVGRRRRAPRERHAAGGGGQRRERSKHRTSRQHECARRGPRFRLVARSSTRARARPSAKQQRRQARSAVLLVGDIQRAHLSYAQT